jgi:hypothetical protein
MNNQTNQPQKTQGKTTNTMNNKDINNKTSLTPQNLECIKAG